MLLPLVVDVSPSLYARRTLLTYDLGFARQDCYEPPSGPISERAAATRKFLFLGLRVRDDFVNFDFANFRSSA